MRRTSICGAAETRLVDRKAAATHLPRSTAPGIARGARVTRSFTLRWLTEERPRSTWTS
jgi:gamma-glutamyl phosphate reductase